ncbi:hypothetical protein SRABI27_04001 [Pedobacter sp. Bi27]|uniref:PIN-like domain-containing protein n=1 Tax=Pedobacter sp. Bi27 TaxID=2822351 RepID=UPI001DB41700|nr:PIN-like domain-containing protein [Pedobacter sp. Bi27]CAH0288711.1 hypothetical protein SRABI27_04001 [Pedobacter sp. Bi27]
MVRLKDKIELTVSYLSKQGINNLKVYKKVLDEYKAGQEKAQTLADDLPIFVDTNVLLNYYEVSFSAREKIMQFFEKYKARIVLSAQVQFEFIKNREKIIHSFQTAVTEQLPRDFQSNVINKFQHFQNENKKKLEDYSAIQKELSKIEKGIKELNEKICKEIEDKKGIANKLVLEDKFLDIVARLQVVDPFDPTLIIKIKEDYDKLKKGYSPDRDNATENYSMNVFPGCAEKGKEDPTGDYIVFHEMMLYSKNKKKDIIFLTNDTTKGDWIRKDGTQHLHYLENFNENTDQMIYILNSDRVLTDLFENTSFESLVPKYEGPGNVWEMEMSIAKSHILLDYLNTHPTFNTLPVQETIPPVLIKELKNNGYSTLGDIEGVLIEIEEFLPIVAFSHNGSRLGLLRKFLKTFNKSYTDILRRNPPVSSFQTIANNIMSSDSDNVNNSE